jgi:hypothetical protein
VAAASQPAPQAQGLHGFAVIGLKLAEQIRRAPTLERFAGDGDAETKSAVAAAVEVGQDFFHGRIGPLLGPPSRKKKNPQKPELMRVLEEVVANQGFEPRTCGL